MYGGGLALLRKNNKILEKLLYQTGGGPGGATGTSENKNIINDLKNKYRYWAKNSQTPTGSVLKEGVFLQLLSFVVLNSNDEGKRKNNITKMGVKITMLEGMIKRFSPVLEKDLKTEVSHIIPIPKKFITIIKVFIEN